MNSIKVGNVTLEYFSAKCLVKREWKIMMVSSKSHMKTRSRPCSDVGPGETGVARAPVEETSFRPLPRLHLSTKHKKLSQVI